MNSNHKNQHSATKQTILTGSNQYSNSKNGQLSQQASKKKSSSRSTPSRSKNSFNSKKPEIHEIINLEKNDFLLNFGPLTQNQKNEQAFISELAKKCGAFFNWINQVDYSVFVQQLWKNRMMEIVGQRFPELNTQQQQKLIDRDWKIMAPQRKQVILKQLKKQIEYEQMNKMVNQDFQKQRNQVYLQFNGRNLMSEQ